MAQEETAGLEQAGSNINALKEAAKKAVDRVNQLKQDRTSINEEIGSIRADLKAKGIHVKAFDMAMTYMNMDPEKREGFDIAYDIVREAIDLPVKAQGDLFDEKNGEADGGQ